MLTVVPMSVLLMGLVGLAVILASVARMIMLEHQLHDTRFLVDPGSQERPRVAA
jgi:hypothetical protein